MPKTLSAAEAGNPTLDPESTPMDSWHYMEFRDKKHDFNYVEWKYFNFVQKDLVGYFVYYILDPEEKTHLGGGRLLARVFKKNKLRGTLAKVPVDEIQFDCVGAGVDMAGAKIAEKNFHNYHINGDLDDISWDLSYEQKSPTVESFMNKNVGLLPWEKASWLIKMPRAKVTGTIKLEGQPIKINATGYSDTNWGEIIPFFSRYDWGQFHDDKISFVFGVLRKMTGVKSNYFYLLWNKEVVPFENTKFKVKHKKWSRDKSTGLKVPIKSEFSISKNNFSVKFRTELLYNDLLAIKVSPILPKAFVSEQIASYEGTIEKSGKIIHKFKGIGFQEWADKTWRSGFRVIF